MVMTIIKIIIVIIIIIIIEYKITSFPVKEPVFNIMMSDRRQFQRSTYGGA